MLCTWSLGIPYTQDSTVIHKYRRQHKKNFHTRSWYFTNTRNFHISQTNAFFKNSWLLESYKLAGTSTTNPSAQTCILCWIDKASRWIESNSTTFISNIRFHTSALYVSYKYLFDNNINQKLWRFTNHFSWSMLRWDHSASKYDQVCIWIFFEYGTSNTHGPSPRSERNILPL